MKIISHLLWLTPFLGFLGGYCIATLFFANNPIQAPTIVGATLEKAIILLSAQELNMRIIDYKEDPATPEGTIISQSPKAGTPLKKNQALYVTVTQKPKPLLMPNGNQASIDTITKKLQQNGIRCAVYPVTQGNGMIVAQSPQADAPLAQEGAYLYTSQLPPKPVIMPSFKGQILQEVVSFLSLYGITPTILYSSPSAQINPQIVHILDQRPIAGTLVFMNQENPLIVQLQV